MTGWEWVLVGVAAWTLLAVIVALLAGAMFSFRDKAAHRALVDDLWDDQ